MSFAAFVAAAILVAAVIVLALAFYAAVTLCQKANIRIEDAVADRAGARRWNGDDDVVPGPALPERDFLERREGLEDPASRTRRPRRTAPRPALPVVERRPGRDQNALDTCLDIADRGVANRRNTRKDGGTR